jgi:hypothetical protein
MRIMRQIALYACTAALVAAGTQSVRAQSNVCVSLEAQLVSLERGGGANSRQQYRELDTAFRRQRSEINRATAEARRARCTGFLLFKRPAEPKCGQLMETIDRMKDNLQRLATERSRYSSNPAQVSRRRNEILRSINANRCRGTQASGGGNRRVGLLESLFGNARTRTWGEDRFIQGGAGRGTYRTLCVRTCDGYYFPISFSTVPQRFGPDQLTCQSMCPGTQVALYTHRNPGEESQSMVSLAGVPYTALPTAFRYREAYNPACSCGSPATGALRTQVAFTPAARLQPSVPLPRPRPVRGEDPETLANRYGGYVVARQIAAAAKLVETNLPTRADLPAAPKVRVVGPSFYYGQQTEIGMLIPARKPRLESELADPADSADL